jgi:DNA-binding transcriptional MerR regulator
MRSKEVAELAGVSVRTLRHYHQVGVLPEPERGSNGYRSYELAHVARLLRIRTLAELGIPLERMPAFLDDPVDSSGDSSSEELLAELAEQLEHRIAHLQSQLRRVAELRTTRARPDLTPVLVEFLEAVGAAEPSGLEQDASILVARLFEADGSPDDLRDLATVLRGVHDDPRYADFVDRFERLAPDAPDGEVREVAENFIAAFGPALTQVLDSTMGGRLRKVRTQDVPAVEVDPRLNDAQAEVLRLFGEAL